MKKLNALLLLLPEASSGCRLCQLLLLLPLLLPAQTTIRSLDLAAAPPGQVTNYWLHFTDNGLGQPVLVPVIVAKGREDGPVLGLVAAIHGNELNGIPVIQQLVQQLDLEKLRGTVVGVPGLNVPGIERHQREHPDGEDLNRLFPGKAKGNEGQQYVHFTMEKLVQHFGYLIDLHTASFGRVNTFYARADMSDPTLAKMALSMQPDIIVSNSGEPSAGSAGDGGRTLRAEATQRGIPCLTVELGNPQVYQSDMTARGVQGIQNMLLFLDMLPKTTELELKDEHIFTCKKSYWLYTSKGGLLEVTVELAQRVKQGELIGILKNPFGEVMEEYFAPEAGVVIGKSSNPVCPAGGRILYLGVP